MASEAPARARAAARLTGVSSGTRMLVILTLCLLPLGLIALFASIRSAQNNRAQHELDAGIIVRQAASQIDILIERDAQRMRAAIGSGDPGYVACRAQLAGLATALADQGARTALYTRTGLRRCASDPAPGRAAPPRTPDTIDVLALGDPRGIRLTVPSASGYAAADIPLAAFDSAVSPITQSHGATLIQGAARLRLGPPRPGGALDQRVTVTAPVAGGQMALAMTINVATVSAIEVLLVLLPILMWLAGAIIGWLVVERLLLRPLADLERAVTRFSPEDPEFVVPRLATPSHEIRNLAEAFRASAAEIATHEAELEQGLMRQTKLTREVHHRVKNNLQVVASLINLHARGTQGDVQRAYASIQRRVDALSVVHRNHYAEMEENRGINLRTLLSELAANLRGSAPPEATHFSITVNMAPAAVTQDTAVPIAFLFTEVIELVMDCDPKGGAALAVTSGSVANRMLLTIVAPGLRGEACTEHPAYERFRRIIEGLARQLRSPLIYDAEHGSYAIEIPSLADPLN
ncbi:sensor histidine kinase [Sphingomonas naphthae]|uniref:histidine kinase n=1 Tax=Sphingomonas naphthae TaxID=1813468 RepID=A0ABY7TKA5_9SPHN|nr:sensor histidine kinase [Sphingomonas naphthae]WCT73380.1 sensor histidine kinase [Sphingomonas naphthae]